MKEIQKSLIKEIFLISFGHLIVNAKFFVGSFRYISFSHVRHKGNIVAYNLARHDKHVRCLVWIEDDPPHLSDVIHMSI